jgi:methylated-DNA-[protein]-cysteine S-methyltransferase
VNNKIFIQYWKSPLGELQLGVYNDHLCLCDWKYRSKREQIDQRILQHFESKFSFEDHPIIEKTKLQLSEYFTGQRKEFDLPIVLVGTPFQKKVWDILSTIPYGNTITYLDLAHRLADSKVIRAAASANGANAISIIIPCHRVVGKNGSLIGYAGGNNAKKKLLELENPVKQITLFEI